ncbi:MULTISPECIES: enoyl-CoA hydratase/isomerase family protein [Streptomyces]|uniref:3-hydroxyisobutyryl-CoA hydrolase n=1 Tax=Streptomyces glycanivorans TaxID=3033808 RepID=A0ABY9J5V6_9ACTN|nr:MULTISPECIES: enoyl-CoA hydratase/isomerase family protein [unclassified Streptomyces]WSQ75750.1 enoyl-CoA hydratase/isomerase family protein [Streptomyces sp. NBC_01213]TXS15682.1 enoyl-CoA hydratase/isomerase family protein [Streptomyces sp. wa22]WLQ62244.1 enoyl-CoA hydratase/isomerase family protein [Streptomyces sp. Alt3]WSQ82998.1 enoyl-CoA hydratase/isomerase family protein [Streptomyces sp. NBC_01212]WSR10974.1 enoyl-CoA hydratase/isomerase family protein [Streptomyces sp. NBC_01208
MNEDEPVLLHTEGHILHITLNRPRALNALTHTMVRGIDEALVRAADDDAVTAVVIDGAGGRGLCAGGDIRSIYEDARSGRSASVDFWRDEYRLNARIARFPKPYVALMDGIVMGGGVGVSAHGDVRVVTERSRIAMPETAIGFVPDVGGTHLLAAAPGELGTHLALTGRTIGAADAILCGLADHFVPSRHLADLTTELARNTTPTEVKDTVRGYATTAPEGELAAQRPWVDECYAADTIEEIIDRLSNSGVTAAKETAAALLTASPTALKVTLAAVRRAGQLGSLEAVLDQEFRVSCRAFTGHDLTEGVRARIIDKDRTPRWTPAEIREVTAAEVARHFEPLGDRELGLSAS